MLPKLLFLINPKAGHSAIRKDLPEVLGAFSREYDLSVFVTSGPGEITKKIAEDGSLYDRIVVSGGDGSLNEAVCGLMQLSQRPILGYLPAGTTNDVASSLRLSLKPQEAVETVLTGEPFAMDLGSFNGRPFSYVAAFGAFTSVSYATPQRLKQALGKLAYFLKGVDSLSEIKPVHAEISSEEVHEEGDFIVGLVCSTTSVAGFRGNDLSRLGISLSDGLSEALFIRYPKDLPDLASLLTELARLDFSDEKHFLAFHTAEVQVNFAEDTPWTVDGEDGGSQRSAVIRNLPQAIQITVPKSK